jgi:hypothetical protein
VRSSLCIVVAMSCVVAARAARAELEVTANLAVGGGVVLSDDPEVLPQGGYDTTRGVGRVGLSTGVTFLRESNRELGLGVYAEVMTSSFVDVMPGVGLSLLLPVHHGAPLVIFAGAHYEYDGHHAGGFGGRIWWGAHNHNHFRVYNATFGLWAEVRGNVWGDNDVIVAGGVDLDLGVVFTPWMWFGSWVRGPSRL